MQIFVRTITCKIIVLDVEISDTIENVRLMLQEKEGYPAEQIQVSLAGVELADGRTLEDYSIQHGATLRLLVLAPPIATASASGSSAVG